MVVCFRNVSSLSSVTLATPSPSGILHYNVQAQASDFGHLTSPNSQINLMEEVGQELRIAIMSWSSQGSYCTANKEWNRSKRVWTAWNLPNVARLGKWFSRLFLISSDTGIVTVWHKTRSHWCPAKQCTCQLFILWAHGIDGEQVLATVTYFYRQSSPTAETWALRLYCKLRIMFNWNPESRQNRVALWGGRLEDWIKCNHTRVAVIGGEERCLFFSLIPQAAWSRSVGCI
jgi:hypothetical protein